ncbi:MAG: cysteine peptidase family C39 domain-containing protein [Planctomycetota bacterium]
MGGWLETTGVILIVVFAAAAGRIFSRLKNPHWGWGYCVPLALITLVLVATYISSKTFLPVLVWISCGRARFIIMGLAVTMGSMTLLGRLKNRVEKAVLLVLMAGVVIWGSVLPFFVPVLIRNDLTNLKTKITADNICVQTTNYTCGPAAAVTALRLLGFAAQEGEIAILSHTSPVVGTLPWCLYKAIQQRYAAQGIECRLRHFDSISELRGQDVTLVVVKDAFLLDHCVTVLEVGDKTITIADPSLGRQKMSHKDFENVWRFYGITLKNGSAQKG